jgi:outer membrane immunogenic protein
MRTKFVALVGVAFGLAFAQAAVAADMPVKARPMAPAPVPFSWTGCYIGAVAGYGWGKSDQDFAVAGNPPAISGTHVDGGTVGGTIGCNYQTGTWVFGVENDLAWAGFKGSAPDIQNPAFTIGTKTTWLDTLRGRVGYAFGNSLVYATGGVAFADVKAFESFPGVPEETISNTRTGCALGGGFEYAFDRAWSAKAEYLHIDFGSSNATGFVNYTNKSRVTLTENIARVGLNYRFSGLFLH